MLVLLCLFACMCDPSETGVVPRLESGVSADECDVSVYISGVSLGPLHDDVGTSMSYSAVTSVEFNDYDVRVRDRGDVRILFRSAEEVTVDLTEVLGPDEGLMEGCSYTSFAQGTSIDCEDGLVVTVAFNEATHKTLFRGRWGR